MKNHSLIISSVLLFAGVSDSVHAACFATDISGGGEAFVAISDQNTVLEWGNAGHQVLTSEPGTFTQVDIASGYPSAHALALDAVGQVWGWSETDNNALGQLPSGTDTRDALQVVDENGVPLTGYHAVAAGGNFSLALSSSGHVTAWGSNTYGALGSGDTAVRLEPGFVMKSVGSPLTNVVSIAAGAFHGVAADDAGTVWAWGFDGGGQMGNGPEFRAQNFAETVLINATTPLSGIVTVFAVPDGAFGIDVNGELWAWGLYQGRAQAYAEKILWDDGTPVNNVTDVSGDRNMTVFSVSSGEAFWWGSAMGFPSNLSGPQPILQANGIAFPNVVEVAGSGGVALLRDSSNQVWVAGNPAGTFHREILGIQPAPNGPTLAPTATDCRSHTVINIDNPVWGGFSLEWDSALALSENADNWWVYMGNTPGGTSFYNSGALGNVGEHEIPAMDLNAVNEYGFQEVHLTLWYRVAGVWNQERQVINVQGPSVFLNTVGFFPNILAGDTERVTLSGTSNGSVLSNWWLYAGSSSGESDYYSTGALGQSNHAYLLGLPQDSSEVFITFWWRISEDSPWRSNEFTVTATQTGIPPAQVELRAPFSFGTFGNTMPDFNWRFAAGASWYLLWINDDEGVNIFRQWYPAQNVCVDSFSSDCSVSPSVTVGPNTTWWVQSWSGSGGAGAWSEGTTFSP